MFLSYKRNIQSNSVHVSEPWKHDWVTSVTEQIFPSTFITITEIVAWCLSSLP